MKVSTDRDFLTTLTNKSSSWYRLVRSIANAKKMLRERSWKRPVLSCEDLKTAEKLLIRADQNQHYNSEVKQLTEDRPVHKQSKIRKLTPCLDDHGMMRMKGRAQGSPLLTFDERNPIILDRSSHLAKLIVRHFHEKTHHQGRSYTLGAVRQAGFWVTGASNLVKSMLNSCVKCRKIRRQVEEQQMGLLPRQRTEPSPPFTNVGVDAFGPFIVRERRSDIKR
ncbi:uncharacterized protein [Watersipora subatra]|uniref:uncharacterized protein n=1 Tax=Watersipora subatra TaxID=2589382 RepID=UPI00355C110A